MSDYEGILMAVQHGSTKAKQLAAQLIPKYFKFFPALASKAASAHFDLLEEEELGVFLPFLLIFSTTNVIFTVFVKFPSIALESCYF